MTAPVLILIVRSGDRVSDAIAREADRLGVASTELLAASARELAELRRRVRRSGPVDWRHDWTNHGLGAVCRACGLYVGPSSKRSAGPCSRALLRERPAERAARARGVVEAVGRAR